MRSLVLPCPPTPTDTWLTEARGRKVGPRALLQARHLFLPRQAAAAAVTAAARCIHHVQQQNIGQVLRLLGLLGRRLPRQVRLCWVGHAARQHLRCLQKLPCRGIVQAIAQHYHLAQAQGQ